MSDLYGVWGRRAEVHSTPETHWTRCDGCRHFTCIRQEKSRLHPWRYRCEKLGRNFEYRELFGVTKKECPEHRDMRGRRFV